MAISVLAALWLVILGSRDGFFGPFGWPEPGAALAPHSSEGVSSTISRCNEGGELALCMHLNEPLIARALERRVIFNADSRQRRPPQAVKIEPSMLDFLHRAVVVDGFTLAVVAMLSGWAGVLTMHVLSRTMLSLIFIPGFVFGAVFALYAFERTGFYPTPDRETNVVVACTLGIIAALFVLLMVLRVSAVISGLRVERHEFRRA